MSSPLNVRGKITVHPRGFGFLEVVDGTQIMTAFVTPPDLNRFLEGDVVAAQVTESDPGRYTASNLTLVERTRAQLFGSLVLHGKKPFLKVDRQVSNTDWPLEGEVVQKLEEGSFVVADLREGRAVALRALPRTADVAVERVSARHGLRTEFPKEVLAEAERVATRKPKGARRDIRHMPTITIDAPHSRDLDDALSVLPAGDDGALRVFVSIADVDAFVEEGSLLDREAELRGTSVYLTGRVLPMLPERLSNEAISLIEGVDRPSMTVELRIDPEGTVTSVDIYESLMRSTARLSYDAVAQFLSTSAKGIIPEAVEDTVRWLRTAAARLSTYRASRGGIELLREEATVTWAAGGVEPTGLVVRADNEAHKMIERLMVAANEAVARWLVERGLPGVFRVHPEPEPDRVRALSDFARNFGFEPGFGRRMSPRSLGAFEAQFRGSPTAPALSNVLGRVLGPARYTVLPSGHFGLAAELYLHFTSPIRRYADLAVHRLVKSYLAGDRDFVSEDAGIEELAVHLNERAYAATKAENDTLRMVAARLFSSRVGETVSCNVVQIKPFGLVVQIVGTGVTGTVATEALVGGPFRVDPSRYSFIGADRTHSIGEALELVVVATNEEMGRIDLAPVPAAVEQPSAPPKPRAPARTSRRPAASPKPSA
jgi:ribonuclease R